MQGNLKAWTGFWLLGLIRGSSCLFIRISIAGSGLFGSGAGGGFSILEIVFIRDWRAWPGRHGHPGRSLPATGW